MNDQARRWREDAVLHARCADCAGRVIAHANWRGGRLMLWTAGPNAEHDGYWWTLDGEEAPDLALNGKRGIVAAWCPWGKHWLDLGAPGWSDLPRSREERVTIPVDHGRAARANAKAAHVLRPARLRPSR